MKKEGIIIGVLAVLVIGLVIFILLRPDAPVVEVPVEGSAISEEELAPEVPTLSLDEAAESIKDEYKDDPQFQQCLAETVEGCLSNVITLKIQETKDLSLCDDYITEQQSLSCKVSQVTMIAREQKDPSKCSVLEENYKVSCESEVTVILAIEKQEPSLCDGLGENYKQNCRQSVAMTLAQETLDEKWCNDLDEEYKEMCKEEIQMYKQEEELQNQQLQDEQELQAAEEDALLEQEAMLVEENGEQIEEE